jgi:hypothetical protein
LISQDLREILNPYPDRQAMAPAIARWNPGSHGTKRDSNGEPFRNIVKGDGDHKERRPAQRRFRTLRFCETDMKVRDYHVEYPEKDPAGGETYGGREPGKIARLFSQPYCGYQERPEACGDHHSCSKTHHSVEEPLVDGPREEHNRGPERGYTPGEASGYQCLNDRILIDEELNHRIPPRAMMRKYPSLDGFAPSPYVCFPRLYTESCVHFVVWGKNYHSEPFWICIDIHDDGPVHFQCFD